MLNIVLAISSGILLILGLTVYYSNPKSRINFSLASFIFAGLVWVLTNLLANISITNNSLDDLFFTRITIIGASLLPLTYLMFVHSFLGDRRTSTYRKFIYGIPVAALLATTFSNFNVKEVGGEIVLGPVYYLIVPFFLISFSYGTGLLIRSYKYADPIKRLQLQYIFWGISFSVIPGLILNAIVPLFGIISTAYFGPSVVIFFALFTSIAIVKHSLLDIRLIVARSIAYLMLVSTLIAIYALVVFGLVNTLSGRSSEFIQEAVPILAALFLAATAPHFKRLFDRITNKFFYRDAYDPQVFLDQLNKALVNNIELKILLRETSQIIEKNLKCSTCHVAVRETNNLPLRIVGNAPSKLNPHDIETIRSELAKQNNKAVVTDDLAGGQKTLKETLSNKDIAMVVCLMPGHNAHEKPLAYLLLGPKKSGNIYNKQDLRIVEIIADELIIAIQNALRFEEIQGFAATLQEKVNQATAKLQQTNKKLRELDETKDEFISMASHQLRTPLTSVKGYMSMVLDGDAGELKKQQKQLLDQAFVSSQRMVYLIADLLNVSRLKTGKFIIDAHPTNLAEVVEGEISQLRETAKRKNLKLTYNKPDKSPQLMLDETKIRQVIMNFADNAIYYTPSGGNIVIELKEDKKNIYFTVKDDGIGVPKREKEHMFTKFYRAKNARKARPDGTGLGLFMAKKVVDAQGGQILFDSEEGKGSTFGFCFNKRELDVKKTQSS